MLEEYFSAPKTLRRLRTGPSGSYIDGFADALKRAGYSKASAIRYLRNAAHLGQFTKRVGGWPGHHRRKHAESFLSSPVALPLSFIKRREN